MDNGRKVRHVLLILLVLYGCAHDPYTNPRSMSVMTADQIEMEIARGLER